MPVSIKRVRALAAAGAVALVLGVPVVAGAQTTVVFDSAEVSPTTVTTVATTAPPEVLGEVVERPAEVLPQTVEAELAVTGGDIAGLAAIGAAAIGAGAFLIAARRRRAQA